MYAVFQLLVAANSGPQLRLPACWNVTPSEGVKRPAARGDEMSLLVDQSQGASSESATSKKPSKPQALAEGRAPCSQRQLLRSFNLGVSYGHDFVTSSRYIETKAGGTMPTRRSSFGADCAHCGKELIAPERSEYRDERHVLHIWRGWQPEQRVFILFDCKRTRVLMLRFYHRTKWST